MKNAWLHSPTLFLLCEVYFTNINTQSKILNHFVLQELSWNQYKREVKFHFLMENNHNQTDLYSLNAMAIFQ